MSDRLAIQGGKKVRKRNFDYVAPIGKKEVRAATDVLKQGRLSGFYKNFLGGEKVREFEKRFAAYIGVRHAVSVNSGTSALHVALAALNIGPGDEVIVPPFTFTATVSAVLMNNAIPVFADVRRDTFCIDSAAIEKVITPRTKAIIPVHIYGKSSDMRTILSLAKKRNIAVLEDACQAPGTCYRGKKVGSIGDLGVFSFVETKNMVIGEGGMVTTNNADLADRCRLIRNHGEAWVCGKPRQYISNLLGYNFRLTEVPAAIGIEQLKRLDRLNEIRQENAAYLEKGLRSFKGIKSLKFKRSEICHIFALLYDEEAVGISRDRFIEVMEAEGILLSKGYPHPLYKNPIFQEKITYGASGCPYSCSLYGVPIDYKEVKCVEAEAICRKLLCIRQIHYPFNIRDMKDIVKAFQKVFDNRSTLI